MVNSSVAIMEDIPKSQSSKTITSVELTVFLLSDLSKHSCSWLPIKGVLHLSNGGRDSTICLYTTCWIDDDWLEMTAGLLHDNHSVIDS